jgi:hypothetical protein
MAVSQARWNHGHAAALLALLILFLGRVAAQLVQRLWPTPLLPDFAAWQSGLLPYGALLASQFLILALVLQQAVQIWRGRARPRRRLGLVLLALGGIYMAGAALRLAAGVANLFDLPFFQAKLPALFHMVLAGVVLVLGDFHFRGAGAGRSGPGEGGRS